MEKRFRTQVEKDKPHLIERVVQGWGVYLPCVEPSGLVDYIFVGMEPSFNWANSIEKAEKKVEKGFRNFDWPSDPQAPLALFRLSIEKYLCQSGETYHLTDLSKGAMPVKVADLDRDRRYEAWYDLLLEEIEIVGKPGASLIAIGKDIEAFLQRQKRKPSRSIYRVPHYSRRAGAFFKREAENDEEGFNAFKQAEFGEESFWPADLSLAMKQLVFTYKKQFEEIRARE